MVSFVNFSKKLDEFNYDSFGKFRFLVLEDEFWKAKYCNDTTTYDTVSRKPLVVNSTNHDGFNTQYREHLDELKLLNKAELKNANIWEVHDCLNAAYHRGCSGDINTCCPYNDTIEIKKNELQLERASDGIITYYYQNYYDDKPDYTIMFLDSNEDMHGLQLSNVEMWKDRLKYLGQRADTTTKILPLFSAQYNYLYNWLDNDTHDLNLVENSFIEQFDSLYNNPSTYPGFENIHNIKMRAFGYIYYRYIDTFDFADKSLVECTGYSHPISIQEYIHPNAILNVNTYPNPCSSNLTIEVNCKNNDIKLLLYDITGKCLFNRELKETKVYQMDFSAYDEGLYLLITKAGNKIISRKIIKY